MPRDRTAALIVIGNEILSGKVADTNSTYLARGLRAAGVTLRRIIVIPDEPDEIAAVLRRYRAAYDVVFTSGGVGPTHDDVTIEGVARGLGRKVVRHPQLEAMLRKYFGGEVDDLRLRMANVVEGTELIYEGTLNFPLFLVENLFILPGIPEIFRDKFDALLHRIAADPFYLRAIYTNQPESSIAAFLDQTLERYPDLLLGSYPKLNDPEYSVRITLESKDRGYLDQAFDWLLGLLPPASVVRTE
jgi:FAD synthetase